MSDRPGLRFHAYDWARGRESLMAEGDGTAAHQLLIVPPLFGEMHRCRRLIRDVMRELWMRDVDCWLPELPGVGESELPLDRVGWDDWIDAVASAGRAVARIARARPHVASLRGGALVDHAAPAIGWWRFSPRPGAALLRDLLRSRQLAEREAGHATTLAALETEALAGATELAGYALGGGLAAGLAQATPVTVEPLRVVGLASEEGAYDAALPGPALWRRAEPGDDPDLAILIAEDIRRWIDHCDGN